MAGTDPNFDSTGFRTAIRAAMTMGAPNDVSQQATFVYAEQATYAPEDRNDNPYDWTEVPVTDIPTATVQIPVAVEYAAGPVTAEGMGEFDASHATLTVLDEDWATVLGTVATPVQPSYVLIGGVAYDIDAPGAVPQGLFDVTVYQLHLSARA